MLLKHRAPLRTNIQYAHLTNNIPLTIEHDFIQTDYVKD